MGDALLQKRYTTETLPYSPNPGFDESLFDMIVKKIEIIDNATIRFHLIGNMKLTETINLKVRCKYKFQFAKITYP